MRVNIVLTELDLCCSPLAQRPLCAPLSFREAFFKMTDGAVSVIAGERRQDWNGKISRENEGVEEEVFFFY